MRTLDTLLLTSISIAIIGSVEAQVHSYCQSRAILCYDCDSHYHPGCGDPFHRSLTPDTLPPTRLCQQGCCVKRVHSFPGYPNRIQRSCSSENLVIDPYAVDRACRVQGDGNERLCLCEHDLCNSAESRLSKNYTIVLTIIVSFSFSFIPKLLSASHL